MFKLLRRLLFEPVYPDPRAGSTEPPQYLSMREIFDVPPDHPPAPPAVRKPCGPASKRD